MHAPLKSKPRLGIILPLYIYPLSSESWKPLYDAVTAHKDLQFLVIVNPNSGPGTTPLPDENYLRELAVLNAHPNIITLGYVSSSYCRRSLQAVCSEIEVYASWTSYQEGKIQVQGIFLDECPDWWQKDANSTYLHAVQSCTEAAFANASVIIHNPGARPAPLPQRVRTTATIIREDSAARFATTDIAWTKASTPSDRAEYAIILYDVPREQMMHLVKSLRDQVGWLYLTASAGYTALDSLAEFCDLVNA
ncbi:hypothetical protein LTR78_003848 [Recurvomyces mirabilis]|uniref:Cell surface protein n=1 Tax=Recurvomyces mirabilis TaxID=574656 RepID=A0AAE0WR30_9PEZI|nr:hypothetical protein LTR78_003848 [Recurvomyces mirabilis]KAK5154013.1 hypothetical protein LTS14_007233 [Recurvomyces mirabilis]